MILTYHYFESVRRLRAMFGERARQWRAAQAAGHSDVTKLKRDTLAAVDAFNVLLDRAFTATRETLTLLRALAPKRKRRGVSNAEDAERVGASEIEHLERLKRLEEVVEL